MTRIGLRTSNKVQVRQKVTIYHYATGVAVAVSLFIACFFYFNFGSSHESKASGLTFYARASGNWSDPNTWSTTCGGPAALTYPRDYDNVVIGCNTSGYTVTVDGNFAANNITLGEGSAGSTLRITSSAFSLMIRGDFRMNPGNNNNTYILEPGPGQMSILGNFSHWGTSGTNSIRLSTGAISFTNSIEISNDRQNITVSDAGTVNFLSNFTDNSNRLVTNGGTTVNFRGSYIVNSINASWNSGSTAIFSGSNALISPNAAITFGNVQVASNSSARLNSGAGSVTTTGSLLLENGANFVQNNPFQINGNVILNASSVYNLNATLSIVGNWTNNGGVLNGGSQIISFNGNGKTIGGSTSTNFPNLQFGLNVGNTSVSYTLNRNATCASLRFYQGSKTRRLTHGTTNPTLTVNGNVQIEQPSSNALNAWYINGGNGTVTGNLNFVGTANHNRYRGLLAVTSGSFNLAGTVNWMSNNSVGTETISVTSGSLTFGSPLAMPRGSGTLRVTSSGTINFNGTSSPSISLNGTGTSTTNAIFSTVSGCTLNFANGITNENAPLIIANNSFSRFTGASVITPQALITFGNITINATVTLAGHIALTNDWTNNSTLNPGTFGASFVGPSGSVQSITRNGGETFHTLSANTAGSVLQLKNNVMVTHNLNMGGHDFDLEGHTLTLGNSLGGVLTRTSGIVYNGNFRRWLPAGTAISSTAGSLFGLFPIGVEDFYRPVAINSTANATTAGYITAWHIDDVPITEANYTDNEGDVIERISDRKSILAINGLAGGTYNIDVSFSGFIDMGLLSDLKLVTYTNQVMGSSGTSVPTLGTVSAPTVRRTGLSATQLANEFVVGTKNRTVTPIRQVFYSRQTGNWSDNSSTGTWTLASGGNACSCLPTNKGLVIIEPGHTVTVNTNTTIDFMKVMSSGTVQGGNTLTVGYDVVTVGSGRIMPTALWTINHDLILSGTGSSSASGLNILNDLNIGSGTSLAINGAGTVNVERNLIVNGSYNIGTGTTTLSGAGASIVGRGSIAGGGNILIYKQNYFFRI